MVHSAESTLWDYRRRVADLYHELRRSEPGGQAWTAWRSARDTLFRQHPQSPLEAEDRPEFAGLSYFPYDPAWRFEVILQSLEPDEIISIGHSGSGETAFRPFGQAELNIAGQAAGLTFFWLEGYGGGVFVPFGDLTNGRETYGGGRYLLDSAKGADLGAHDGKVIIDFNFAYHPSCVHSPRWSCPLAPPQNRLPVKMPAGERL